jgi:hypothetical protein
VNITKPNDNSIKDLATMQSSSQILPIDLNEVIVDLVTSFAVQSYHIKKYKNFEIFAQKEMD